MQLPNASSLPTPSRPRTARGRAPAPAAPVPATAAKADMPARAEARELPRPAPAPAPVPMPVVPATAPLCVIVDDDVGICTAFQQYLEAHGWMVQVAASAEQGLELLDDLRFLGRPVNLLLLDISLPGIDGIRAVELYRRLLHLQATVIVMSAYYGPEVLEELRAQGVHLFLEKPVDLVRFERLLADLPLEP